MYVNTFVYTRYICIYQVCMGLPGTYLFTRYIYIPTYVYTRYICVYQVTIKLSVSLHEDGVLYSEYFGLMLTNGPLNFKTQLVL